MTQASFQHTLQFTTEQQAQTERTRRRHITSVRRRSLYLPFLVIICFLAPFFTGALMLGLYVHVPSHPTWSLVQLLPLDYTKAQLAERLYLGTLSFLTCFHLFRFRQRFKDYHIRSIPPTEDLSILLKLEKDSLVLTLSGETFIFPWTDLVRVIQTHTLLLLLFQGENNPAVVQLPLSLFPSTQAIEVFRKQLGLSHTQQTIVRTGSYVVSTAFQRVIGHRNSLAVFFKSDL